MIKQISLLFLICVVAACQSVKNDKIEVDEESIPAIRGWNILSDDTVKGMLVISNAENYQINHLQLSHNLMKDLKDVRNPQKLHPTRKLLDAAHHAGIEEVLVWDHSLYSLSYYPERFKNKDGRINLDNPLFWKWIKDDYRSMLDSLPGLDGIVMTFIETGAHVEDQYSEKWKTESEKLANLVDSLASVIIDERGLELYIRTFIYTRNELESLLGCVNLVQNPKVKIMSKEVPHDFFLTHPVSSFINRFNKDVIIEFDLGHEYNGQGIIASIFPKTMVERWRYFATQKNVIGYVARTDRYGDTQNVSRATEVNLYALKRISENPELSADSIVAEFIAQKYGNAAVKILKPVFLETEEIFKSVLYTLGLHMNSHSALELEDPNTYGRHCSGIWLENPVVNIGHGVNKEFHYWKDIVENLSPARYKSKNQANGKSTVFYQESPWIIDSGWLSEVDKMNETYLGYVITEKEYGVQKAKWAIDEIKKANPLISSNEDYEELLHLYERTWLTSRLYLASAKAYFGYRTWLNYPGDEKAKRIATEGLNEIDTVSSEMEKYPFKGPVGQYSWIRDVHRAKNLHNKITNGWDVYRNRKLN
ncbi:hypothetical protein ACUNWD_06600 [Sunxiuqinia sp. A32]|uniref:hypothetical protein n=1 Tax=Sunxiuqinia sp. A32 TaxID=3461496 RepID=UPI0040455C32